MKTMKNGLGVLFFLILTAVLFSGCDRTPPATEEELQQINSEAQTEAKQKRLRDVAGYMTPGDATSEIYANDFFGFYCYFGSWDYQFNPSHWDDDDYQKFIGGSPKDSFNEIMDAAEFYHTGATIFHASYGEGYAESTVSIRKEEKDENFDPETYIDEKVKEHEGWADDEFIAYAAPDLLDLELTKSETTFCGANVPAILETDFVEKYEHRYYKKTIWIKKNGFIAEISTLCYDNDDTDKLFDQYMPTLQLLKVWFGLPIEFDEEEKDGEDLDDFDVWQVNTDKTPLTIREKPSKDSKKIGSLSKGAIAWVTAYDETGQWGYAANTETNNENDFTPGWINLEYCTDCIAMGGGWVYLLEGEPYYHTKNCEELKDYSNETIKAYPRDDASEDGYEPCPKCGGF